MSTSAITPSASAPAGGAAPSAPAGGAPAGGTSAPVSTPAEGSGAEAGGAAPDTSGASDNSVSVEQRIADGWSKQFGDKEGGEEAPEGGEEEPPEIGEGEAEEGETDQALEGTGEEEAPAGEETPAAEQVPEFTLDDGEAVGPEKFADFLKANPEASKALDSNPELKNKVFGALRRDAENRELREIVPDVETAKAVTGAAANYQNFDNRFLQATTPDGAKAFLEHWVREAMYTDDKGQPLLKDGKYQFHPALSYTFDHIFNNKLSALKEQAGQSGNERLQAALDVLTEELSPDSAAQSDFPEELRPHAEALKKEREQFQAQKDADARRFREQQEVANQQSIDRSETTAANSVRDLLKPLFAKAALSEFEQDAALQKIGEAVDKRLGANPLYQAMYDSILQREPGEDREKALTAHMLKFANEILGGIATKVVREAKGGALGRQATTQSKVDVQKRTSAADPRRTSVASTTRQATADPTQLRSQIVNEYAAAHNGERPDATYLITEMAKRSGAFGKQKK